MKKLPRFGGRSCLPVDARLVSRLTLAVCAAWCWGSAPTASPLAASDGVGAGASQAASAGRSSGPAAAVPLKVRRYAERLVHRYDLNGDGQLQSDEWSKMQGDPAAADANHDRVVTLDEWIRYITAFGRNQRVRPANQEDGANAGATSGAAAPGGQGDVSEGTPSKAPEGAKKTAPPGPVSSAPSRTAVPRDARFYVPKSRLPAGLPPWFVQRDTNGDGQVSLSEFAPNATQSALQEFVRHDKNGDGFITPQECGDSSKPTKTPSAKATGLESPKTKAGR